MDPIPNLTEAARAGNINGLYEAIKANPNVLKAIDEIQFVNTPLHEAASTGQTNFAIEMIRLAPSFGRRLNPDGLSPLDLAVINNHNETVKRLVSFDGKLARVKGKEGLTPLHRAAESDDKIGCLIELLRACPASIKDLTIRDETALHVAMKSSSSAETFNILYEWYRRAGGGWLLRKKDAEGKSAEAHHNEQPQSSLQSVQGEIPSSLANADADTKSMYNHLRTPERFQEILFRTLHMYAVRCQRNLTMEMRNVVLVVAVLIATASFQAILSPPSGLENRNKNSARREESNSFLVSNSMAFAASAGVIATVLPMTFHTVILYISLISMTVSYRLFLKLVPSPREAFWSIDLLCVYLGCTCILKPVVWRWKQNFRRLHQVGALTFG